MTIENRLQRHITENHDSVAEFCRKYNIPSSTLFTAFKRGINNTSTTTVLKVCSALNIDADALGEGRIVEKKSVGQPSEVIDMKNIIIDLESNSCEIVYKNIALSEKQKEMIAFSLRNSLETAIKYVD